MPMPALDHLRLTRFQNIVVSDDRSLRRAAAKGTMTRLLVGAYVPTAVWRGLDRVARHRLAAGAAAQLHSGFIASHRTAAILWDMPVLGRGDGLVHARATAAAGTRTEHGYRKHAVQDLDLHVVEVDGVRITSLERTVIDLASTEVFECAVVAADWALAHGATKESLRATLDELAPRKGRARIEAVIAFADGASGSVGESYSRAEIERAGFPRPILQARFDDAGGLIGFVDFYWPAFRLIGEFDGFEKYSNQSMLRDRTPSAIVWAEKLREDRLRATTDRPTVTRWVWRSLVTRGALGAQLAAAGLPRTR